MEIRRNKSNSKLTKNAIEDPDNPHLKYELAQMLGQGQYGKVYKAYKKAQHRQKLQQIYAVKIIPLSKLKKNPKLKQLLTNEVEILSSLQHESIIKFEQLFVWEDRVYMVYEYCEGGDLESIIPIPQNQALPVFESILSACSLAQKHNILHRDLKPANILFKNGQPKVADWGFSRELKSDVVATSFVGSPAYMAPELLRGEDYTSKADVWSFGVMLYESIFGQMPWSAGSVRELLQKVKKQPLQLPDQTLPVMREVLRSCLEIDPDRRASFHKLEKIFCMYRKMVRTQSHENPQQKRSRTELTEDQIRKCAFYLQFAKKLHKFENAEVNNLCLQLILSNLRKIRQKNELSITIVPCLSQRKMSVGKRQVKSPRTSSKLGERSKLQRSQTQSLLDKQIRLIEKIKQTTNPSKITTPTKNPENQKKIIKNLIKQLLKNIHISQNRESCRTSKKQLIEMHCVLETIMFEELPQQDRNKKLSQKIKQLEQSSLSSLIRSVNHKILHINSYYCRP